MQLSNELIDHAFKGGFINCKDLHLNSCNYNTWLKFKMLIPLALKFYTPIHLIPVLIFKRGALSKE